MTASVVAAVGTNWCAARLSRVGKYKITVVNEEFSTSEEYDCRDQVRAREQAIKSVFAIAAEQVAAGKPFFGAHVIIEDGTPPQLELVVSAGASPLTKQDEA